MGFEGFHLFCVFQLFSIKSGFGGEDRLWKKIFVLATDRAWNSLSIGIFCFHFSTSLLVRKCEILESTKTYFHMRKNYFNYKKSIYTDGVFSYSTSCRRPLVLSISPFESRPYLIMSRKKFEKINVKKTLKNQFRLNFCPRLYIT